MNGLNHIIIIIIVAVAWIFVASDTHKSRARLVFGGGIFHALLLQRLMLRES